jgi:hypothetical protein
LVVSAVREVAGSVALVETELTLCFTSGRS